MKKEYIVGGVLLLVFMSMAVDTVRVRRENKSLSSQLEAIKKDPQILTKEEVKKVTDRLSKLVVLPTDEEPVVATVTDKEKLKDQPIFAKAENGDKILIYSKAQKAYIYNPEKNILVDVVLVNVGGGQTQMSITGVSEGNPLEVALVNGSKQLGVTGELEKRLVAKNILGLKIVGKATAKTDTYDRTVVYDVTGQNSQQVKELAGLLGAVVATQSSEMMPKAEVMVVIGADFK